MNFEPNDRAGGRENQTRVEEGMDALGRTAVPVFDALVSDEKSKPQARAKQTNANRLTHVGDAVPIKV